MLERSIAALVAVVLAASLISHWRGQDVLHLYVVSPATEQYQVNSDSDSGFPANGLVGAMLFPRRTERSGEARVNFPVQPDAAAIRVYPGETQEPITITKICLEQLLGATQCLSGAELASGITELKGLRAEVRGTGLLLQRSVLQQSDRAAGFVIGGAATRKLKPPPLFLFLTEALLFACAAVFFYLLAAALLRPLVAWWDKPAGWTLAIALLLRAIFFALYAPGTVSDSDLFLRYLNHHIFDLPGIRGMIYPSFLVLFGKRVVLVYLAQLTLGACGAVIVNLLLRSFGRSSRRDRFWAIAATSIPTLLAMEALVLSESLSLFLLLAALLILRWVQTHPACLVSAAGLGCCTALLYHTKPQFGFVVLVMAAALWLLHEGSARRLSAFLGPVAALWLFAIAITDKAGNFRGVSSTLGYSLFNHGQRMLHCPDPKAGALVQFYCRAEGELGVGGSPLSYTAWVIYPAIHELKEPFPQVTADYARLSLDLIGHNPQLYLIDVWHSFVDFWTDRISMVDGLYQGGDRSHPLLRPVTAMALRVERVLRDGLVAVFLIAVCAGIVFWRRFGSEALLFCAVTSAVVMGSATLQALVEFGPENARLETPTEPYLLLTVLIAAAQLRNRLAISDGIRHPERFSAIHEDTRPLPRSLFRRRCFRRVLYPVHAGDVLPRSPFRIHGHGA